MNKYTQYLDSNLGEESLLSKMLEQVEKREFEEAYGTAMRIKAIKDIKWELLKIDERNK
ncbi:MAG: hypothetical protein WCW14_00615 [Candidatus Paceibacterota bacterium]|jgi:hypothetical protein